jgi:hypothetical protein
MRLEEYMFMGIVPRKHRRRLRKTHYLKKQKTPIKKIIDTQENYFQIRLDPEATTMTRNISEVSWRNHR